MDELLPNSDTVNQTTFTPNAQDATAITVVNGARFRPGDLVRPNGSREVLFVISSASNVVTVIRRYGNSPASNITNGQKFIILANAALEGDDMPDARFTNRTRKRNYTQIFTAGVQVSGTMLAARQHGIDDELDYQKQERTRELLRDLENCAINGVALTANQAGGSSVRRTMNGIIPSIVTNQFTPSTGPIPAGDGGGTDLNEAIVNAAMRQVWENSSARVDTILVGAALKRRINTFMLPFRESPVSEKTYSNIVSAYESDFGRCRVVMSRWVPGDTMVLLDSSRVEVLPLSGRSFYYKPHGSVGDRESGQVIGEYTVEMRNEAAHGLVRGLT